MKAYQQPNYIIVLSAACLYICAIKHSVTCVISRHIKAHVVESVHFAEMCVMKLLVCRFNCRDICTYIVINVHSSLMSAINHLLIGKVNSVAINI